MTEMRAFRPMRMPKSKHHIILFIVKQMNEQRVGVHDICIRSGVPVDTIRTWMYRSDANPGMMNVEAVLSVLGYDLTLMERDTGEKLTVRTIRARTTNRGRPRKGPKLSYADACEIRALYKSGLYMRVIAERYGVTRPMIGYIIRGIAWK